MHGAPTAVKWPLEFFGACSLVNLYLQFKLLSGKESSIRESSMLSSPFFLMGARWSPSGRALPHNHKVVGLNLIVCWAFLSFFHLSSVSSKNGSTLLILAKNSYVKMHSLRPKELNIFRGSQEAVKHRGNILASGGSA